MDMELKIKDVAELLQVSEKTVYRWVNDHKIPSYKVNGQYRFRRNELDDWLQRSRQEPAGAVAVPPWSTEPVDLRQLLRRGGIHYKVGGRTAAEAIAAAVALMPLPEFYEPAGIVEQLLQREALAPTALGDGLAMPHSREPVFNEPNAERVGIFFLHQPVDFGALDKLPVQVLLLVLSSDRRRHLQTIRQLGYLIRRPDFAGLLQVQALREDIFGCLEKYQPDLLH